MCEINYTLMLLLDIFCFYLVLTSIANMKNVENMFLHRHVIPQSYIMILGEFDFVQSYYLLYSYNMTLSSHMTMASNRTQLYYSLLSYNMTLVCHMSMSCHIIQSYHTVRSYIEFRCSCNSIRIIFIC